MHRNNALLIQLLSKCNFLPTKAASLKTKNTLELADVNIDTTYLSKPIEAKIVKNILSAKTAGRQFEGLKVNFHTG